MKTPVKAFFEEYAKALLSLSAEKISSFYKTPLSIYSDYGVQAVKDNKETLSFWKEGIKPYQAMHIEQSIPEVLEEEQLCNTIFTGKVLWKNYDKSGKEIAQETNFYILVEDNNKLKIRGLVIMSPS